jgi:uncharacterized protein (TIGR02246 family)
MAQFGDPRETVKAAEAAINAGDLEAMVSLYEREALFISSGQVAAGLAAIRETIAGFLATNQVLSSTSQACTKPETLHSNTTNGSSRVLI